MRGLRTISNLFRHTKSNVLLLAGITVFGALLFSGLGMVNQGTAHAASSNDIVYGGIYGKTLASKCTGDVKTIMDHYRIDCNLTGVVDGVACRDNNVYVGSTVVAREAYSLGRNQKSGDSAVSIGGKTYWQGKNSTAFASECLNAYVKLDANGSFVYAILKDCGNPIWTPKPVVKIKVCDLTTKQIVVIREDQFDSSKYSKNLADCEVKYIQVCEIATGKIVTIKESDFNSSKYSKNLEDCKVKTIQVCELATNKIVTINEKDFDSSKYSKNLDDCTQLQVCDLTTHKIVTINKKDFDSNKYSKNVADCNMIEVCELSTKKIVTIKEADFNSSKYSKNTADCKECVENPKAGITCGTNELPQTGIGGMMGGALGIGSLTAAGSAYIASRKNLLSALRNRK